MAWRFEGGRRIRWGRRATGVAAAGLCAPAPVAALSGVGSPAPTGSAYRLGSVATSRFSGDRWGDPKADDVAKAGSGKNAATTDPGSLYTIETAIGARKVWAQKDSTGRQITGQGVTVALLDSGTARYPVWTAPEN